MKKVLLILVAVLFSTALFAENVDQNRAKLVARNFAAQRERNTTQLKLDVVYSHPMPEKRDAALYVVNLGESGFVIVSANDAAHPVLGYSLDRPWPTDGDIAPQVAAYLDDLASQIEFASEQEPDRGTKAEWQELLINSNDQINPKNNRNQVGPLLTTTWGQGQYYNAMCPADANGPGGHALTGCVATAMAQIIHYVGYPQHGRGIHSYQNDYGTTTLNYDESYYNYDNMPDMLTSASSQEEINAVAKLMYDCGVANSMDYGATSSGSHNESFRSAFINHFGFPMNLGIADRHMHTEDEWVTLLRNEIDLGSPVFYKGNNALNAHAFVLDGYKEDGYFHFNFGWNGSSDGWYLTSAINPSWEFNYWQSVIVGIRPNNTDYSVLCQNRSSYECRGLDHSDRDYYTVTTPINLYNVGAKNDYQMDYDDSGSVMPIIMHMSSPDESGQLVLDVLKLEEGHAIVVYDGANMDELICVLEPMGEGWPHANLPNDTQYQQYVTNDLSPLVSSQHGFTIIAYCDGIIKNEFHLLVSDADDCRMVSNIEAVRESAGYRLNWTPNGSATQWQVVWNDNEVVCDSPTFFIEDGNLTDNCEIKIRSVCGEDNYSEWNAIILNEKKYWPDYVVEEPEGFARNGNTVIISSAEGLAWWIRQCENYTSRTTDNSKTIVFNADIDLGEHLWKPIIYYGKIKGNGHIIDNLRTGYFTNGSGLFSQYIGDTISDLHMKNAIIWGEGGMASLVGHLNHGVIINCSTTDYIVRNNLGTVGGLIGWAEYSRIINCSAIGENYGSSLNGGILGDNSHTDCINCYTSQGSSFQWDAGSFSFSPGLISGIDYGGCYDNCYADIKNTKRLWDPEYDSIAKLYYFFGYTTGHGIQIESAINVATFRVEDDSYGRIIQDTAVNYTLGENMDLLTALNNKVIEINSPKLRVWVWDNDIHFPVMGDYYEPSCYNVGNLSASNISYNDGFAVALSWIENGDAEEWQVKCIEKDAPENSAMVYTANSTNYIIEGLTLGRTYQFYVRPVCEYMVSWGEPKVLFVDKTYWVDMVTECPAGYVEDEEGNVFISTAEGLAWLDRRNNMWQTYSGKTVYIVNDIDMGAYRWKPMPIFWGILEGNNHTISNIICRESTTEANTGSKGFLGSANNTMIRNIIIKDGIFSGHDCVGSLFGSAMLSTFDNCRIVNTTVSGQSYVGGFGGIAYSSDCVIRNCSTSGVVYADQNAGGMVGGLQSDVIMKNCFSNTNMYPLEKIPIHLRGGLLGVSHGVVSNCYSAGFIVMDNSMLIGLHGASVGMVNKDFEFGYHNVYAQQIDGLQFIGRVSDVSEYDISDTIYFSNSGSLATPVTINDNDYSSLLDALNAWVDANNTNGEYRYWTADTEGVNGGFPIFDRDDVVKFADANVKAICVANWDADGDGELSYDEAAAVTDLGTVFKYNSTITSFDELQFFTGLSSIPSYTFIWCGALSSVVIPENVTSIENSAFAGCTSLTNVVLPSNITSLGVNPWANCPALEQITVENGNPNYDSREGCNAIIETSTNTLITGCKNTVIPNAVTAIAGKAFYYCNNLASIDIPNTVAYIGMDAYTHCTNATSITIPASVVEIEGNPFPYCTGVESIVVNESNPVFDSRENCNAIINKNTNTLVSGCKNTVIPNGVESIGGLAFHGISGLTSINIPNTVTYIGVSAFNQTAITSVEIPNSVTFIGNAAFAVCSNLTSVTLPGQIASIASNTFNWCSSLTSITIPASVTTIGAYAFEGCTSLTSITCYAENVPELEAMNAFQYVNKDIPVNVPCGTIDAYEAAEGWSEFTNYKTDCPIVFADDLVKAICVANWDTNGDGELSYEEAAAVTDLGEVFKMNYTITTFDELQYFTGLTVIGDNAFAHCLNLTSVVLPNTVTDLGWQAFYDCRSLLSITIPASVNYIVGGALNCGNLEMIVVEEGNEVYDSRENCNAVIVTESNMLFRGCKNTIIPNSVVTIGENAFSSCTIESVYIPASITSIHHTSFYDCEFLSEITVSESNPVYDSRNNCNAIIETSTNKLIAGSKITVIPNTVTSIDNQAFSYRYRSGSYNITIPELVTSIGYDAFLGGYAIESVTVLAEVPPTLGNNAFDGVPKDIPVHVPCGTMVAYSFAPGWSEFTNYQLDENCPTIQTTALTQGWNWYSTFIDMNDVDGLSIIEEELADDCEMIWSQTAFVTNYGVNGWYGSLNSIANEQMYRLKMTNPATLTLTGVTADPADYPITLSAGWNHIGYVSEWPMSLNNALSGLTPMNGDMIKTQRAFAMYYEGYGWNGSLSSIKPGDGLMYKSLNENDVTFVYPQNSKGEANENLTAENNHWVPEMSDYPTNMTVMAVVEIDNQQVASDDYELAVFANGECRGSVQLVYVELADRYMAFLTIAGDKDENLYFGLYNRAVGSENFNAENGVVFQADNVIGSFGNPFVVSFESGIASANEIAVYPNPVKAGESVNIVVNESATVEIVNALGEVVAVEKLTGNSALRTPATAGVYMLRIITGDKVVSCRRIVLQ